MNNRVSRGAGGGRTRSGLRRTRDADAVHAPKASAEPATAGDGFWEALRSSLRLQILEAIATKPGIKARDLADAIGTSAPRLHYHIKILVRAGLIRATASPTGDSEERVAGTGFEIARTPSLRESAHPGNAAFQRLADLFVEHASNGVAAAAAEIARNGAVGGFSVARCGHESLAPHEVEAVLGHLQAIEGVMERARERRRRAKAVSKASVFMTYCLCPVYATTLPDGMPGWGELPQNGNGASAGAGRKSGRQGGSRSR